MWKFIWKMGKPFILQKGKSEIIMKPRIIFYNDSTKNLAKSTKVLLKGEIAIEYTESGTTKFKVGDGVSTWNELPYCFLTPEETEALIAETNHTHENKEILDAIEAPTTADMKSDEMENTMKSGIKYVNKICVILSFIILIAMLVFNIGYVHGEKLETEKHEKEETVENDEIHEINESDVKEITITTKSGKTYHFSSSERDDN